MILIYKKGESFVNVNSWCRGGILLRDYNILC